MKKTVVVYESKYNSTKKYAEWIAGARGADLFERSKIKAEKLREYDTIIYGGGIYAGRIAGVSLINKNYETIRDRELIVFTVGIRPTDDKAAFATIIKNNFPGKRYESIKFFHLRGAINYKKLGITHRSMLAMFEPPLHRPGCKKNHDLDKNPSDIDGLDIDFTDIKAIKPILLEL